MVTFRDGHQCLGAEVTAINTEIYRLLLGKPKLGKPTRVLLYGASHHTLDVLGQFTGWLKHGKRSARQAVYIVGELATNLLGLQARTQLQLVSRVNATSISEPDVLQQFPNVFLGLGNIGDECTIKLKVNATPYSLYVR